MLKALLSRSVCKPRKYRGMQSQVRKPPQEVSEKPTVELELSISVPVVFAPQELCAQHLSKSPKGKRAIPGAGGCDCHPRALMSVHRLTSGLSRLSCSSAIVSVRVSCVTMWSKACPCVFCTKAVNHQEGELAAEEMGILGAWLGSPAYINLSTSAAWVRAQQSPEFMPCSCLQVLGLSLDLELEPLLGCSFNYLWGFILIF